MKRLLAVALATVLLACLLSLSVSADFSSYDSSNLSTVASSSVSLVTYTSSILNSVNNIYSSLSTISRQIDTLGNYMISGHSNIVSELQKISAGFDSGGSFSELLEIAKKIKNDTGSMSTDVVDIAEDVDTIRSDTRTIMDYVEGSLDNFLASIDQHVGFVDRYTTELYLAYVSDDHDVVRGDGSELTAQLPTLFGLQFETVDSLPYILRGGKDSTLKNTIYDSQTANDDGTLETTDWEANNILSAFSVLFPIQHDVARLTNVLATGPKIQLEKSQEENIQAVTDNFTGDKGVQSSQIGDMSGIGDSLGSVADTGVSVGDGFAQVGNSWNFFSSEVAATLDTAPALTAEDEEDYISFFDSNNADFDSLLSSLRGE